MEVLSAAYALHRISKHRVTRAGGWKPVSGGEAAALQLSQRRGARRPGAVAGVVRVPARHTGHFSDQRIRAEGQAPRWPRPTDPGAGVAASGYGAGAHCVEVWGRGVLRRGVGQRGAASGCGAGAYRVGVWRRGVLRRNVEHGIGTPRCPSTRPVALAGPPGWGCAGCGAARVGLRWMWGRPGGAALDVGPLGWKCAWRGAGGAGT